MSLNGFLKDVPLRADMITILPFDAAFSANVTIYMLVTAYIFVKLALVNADAVKLEPRVTELAESFDSDCFLRHSKVSGDTY